MNTGGMELSNSSNITRLHGTPMRKVLAFTVAALFMTGVNAQTQFSEQPTWPCPERKVMRLAATAFWSGPDVEDSQAWKSDKEVSSVAQTLVSRRTRLEKGTEIIDSFAKKNESDKRQRLILLFTAVFSETNRIRTEIMTGLVGFEQNRKSKVAELANAMIAEVELARKINKSAEDEARASQLKVKIEWMKHVYDNPSEAGRMVCQSANELEERLFEFGRLIDEQLQR